MNLFDLYAKIIFDDSEYVDGIENAGKRGNIFVNNIKASTVAMGNLISRGVEIGAKAIKNFVQMGIGYNSNLETYKTNFEVMLGNAEAAKAKVAELAEMGANTPFELSDLADATQTLLAFNVSADASTGVLQKLGDISLGNVQKLESLTRAYGKMNSSQKVTLEDINMMIDAGYNPLLNIQEATGESMEQLYERISKGEVAFSEIELAIEAATGAGGKYYEGMEKASKTTKGLISTLKDNAQALVAKVFTPISNGLTGQVLPAAIDAVKKLSDAYEERGIEGMIEAAGEIVGKAVGEIAINAPRLIQSGVLLVESLANGITQNEDAIIQGAGDTFFAFVNGIVSLIPTLAGTAIGLVSGFARYIAENPDKVIEAAGKLIAQLVIGLAEALPELAVSAIAAVAALGTYLVENAGAILSSAAEVGAKVLEGIWQGIQNGWANLTAKVKSTLSGLLDGISFGMNVNVGVNYDGPTPSLASASNAFQNSNFKPNMVAINGSHAGGLDYVPFDGYIAELHRGEQVLTANEARQRNHFDGPIQIIINGIEYDSMRELAQDVAEEIQFLKEREEDSL